MYLCKKKKENFGDNVKNTGMLFFCEKSVWRYEDVKKILLNRLKRVKAYKTYLSKIAYEELHKKAVSRFGTAEMWRKIKKVL